MYKILIVEDDAVIAAALREHLEKWGYQVQCADDFTNIMGQFAAFGPHLVLMDIGLPFFNGYHWCAAIRQVSKVPVIFLSSACDNLNVVMAVSMGGDDFIAKPFALEVVSAKVQALLRRAYDFGAPAALLEHRGAVLDLSSASLSYNGKTLDLTKNEFRMLRQLLERKGRVVTREEMMEKLWESDCFVDDNTLTVNVTRLRRRLEEAGLGDFIKTKKGVGYLVEG